MLSEDCESGNHEGSGAYECDGFVFLEDYEGPGLHEEDNCDCPCHVGG